MTTQPAREPVKFIDNLWTFAIAVAVTGPFALPLLWRNPRFSRTTKIVVSVLVIVLTILLLWGSKRLLGVLVELNQMPQGDF